jgi:hypothetical protein
VREREIVVRRNEFHRNSCCAMMEIALTPDLLAFEKRWRFVEIGKEEDGREEEVLMLRRNLTLCVCVFHQRERLMTTTRQQESRVMQWGICDDVFFLFSLENPPLFCSELQQGFGLKAG